MKMKIQRLLIISIVLPAYVGAMDGAATTAALYQMEQSKNQMIPKELSETEKSLQHVSYVQQTTIHVNVDTVEHINIETAEIKNDDLLKFFLARKKAKL